MSVLVKVNPATYGVASIRQVVLGASASSTFEINVLGHTMSIWDNVAVMSGFGVVMILLAMWSFGHQE
jgi:hypothetical protein